VPSPLLRFVILYALLYAAFGVSSPFMPAFLASRGLSAEELGFVFGAGTAVRLISSPVAGRIGDAFDAVRAILAVSIALSAMVALGLLSVAGFWAVFAVSLCQAAALAPTTVLADALALRASRGDGREKPFEYGWVRGTGSAAFIAGTLTAGQVVGRFDLAAVIAVHAFFLAGAAGAALRVPKLPRAAPETTERAAGGVRTLIAIPAFRRLVLVAALILGSHAMHDAFAVIRWTAAGTGPAASSVLWSESVAAEVLVFFVLGPALVDRLGPAGTMMLAAVAGAVRWVVMASTTDVVSLALVQPLHGITFAALHLACMRLIAGIVPVHLAATAQAVYATGATLASAAVTMAAGVLYARFGAQAFLAMALLCAAALPLALTLRRL
jgi:MFS transporter, PPP family, 3-phenylpropionic acid transporter